MGVLSCGDFVAGRSLRALTLPARGAVGKLESLFTPDDQGMGLFLDDVEDRGLDSCFVQEYSC